MVLVKHCGIDIVDVPADGVAEQYEQQYRQDERQYQAAQVTPKLDCLFPGYSD
jgi:hypothetical protein